MLHFTVILHFTVCFYAGPFVFTQASLFLRRLFLLLLALLLLLLLLFHLLLETA